jgi:hypothetical protein
MLQINPALRHFTVSADDPSRIFEDILRHPFFWADRHAIGFLIAVYEMSKQLKYTRAYDKLGDVVSQVIKEVEIKAGKRWFEIVDTIIWAACHVSKYRMSPKECDHALAPLRFHRNCWRLDREPHFLTEFPMLVPKLWRHIIRDVELGQLPMMHAYMTSVSLPMIDDWI